MEKQYIIYEIKQEHFQREFHRDTNHSQERRKITNKQPKLTHKVTREEEQIKPQVSKRKEIIKIIAEINEIKKKK